MSPDQLIRRGGLALLLGAVLWGVGEISWGLFVLSAGEPAEYPQPTATILWVLVLVGLIFIMLGLPSLYAVQARQARALGLVGFVVLFVGHVLMAGIAYFGATLQHAVTELLAEAEDAGITPEEPAAAGIGYLAAYGLSLLGWILLGVASLRAGVLPRWPIVLVIVVPALFFVVNMSGAAEALGAPATVMPLLFAIGVAWLGLALIRRDEVAGVADYQLPSSAPSGT